MQTQTHSPKLDEATIAQLQKLIEMNIDSAEGFGAAAAELKSVDLQTRFRAVAANRNEQATELQAFVAKAGEQPKNDGTVRGSLRRSWLKLHAAVTSGDGSVLADAEHGEDIIKKAYEKALIATAGSPVTSVLQHQMARIKEQHDIVRDLRDHLAS